MLKSSSAQPTRNMQNLHTLFGFAKMRGSRVLLQPGRTGRASKVPHNTCSVARHCTYKLYGIMYKLHVQRGTGVLPGPTQAGTPDTSSTSCSSNKPPKILVPPSLLKIGDGACSDVVQRPLLGGGDRAAMPPDTRVAHEKCIEEGFGSRQLCAIRCNPLHGEQWHSLNTQARTASERCDQGKCRCSAKAHFLSTATQKHPTLTDPTSYPAMHTPHCTLCAVSTPATRLWSLDKLGCTVSSLDIPHRVRTSKDTAWPEHVTSLSNRCFVASAQHR